MHAYVWHVFAACVCVCMLHVWGCVWCVLSVCVAVVRVEGVLVWGVFVVCRTVLMWLCGVAVRATRHARRLRGSR